MPKGTRKNSTTKLPGATFTQPQTRGGSQAATLAGIAMLSANLNAQVHNLMATGIGGGRTQQQRQTRGPQRRGRQAASS